MNTIIVPTLNEENNIAKVLLQLKQYAPSDSEIIVVDNGSKDNTTQIARENGAQVHQIQTKGKGSALLYGASKARGEILIFIDGDASYCPRNIKSLVDQLSNNEKDLVYGSRFLVESKRSMSITRFIGNKFFSLLGFILYGKSTDFLTGFLGIKKEKFIDLGIESHGFEIETELFTKALKHNLKIAEIPIEYQKNAKSNLNPLVDGSKILGTLFNNLYA